MAPDKGTSSRNMQPAAADKEKGVMGKAWKDFMAWSIPCSRMLPCLLLLLPSVLTMTHQDLSRRPIWPIKDKNREVGNEEITSSDLSEALVEGVKHQMEKELYMAILHASTILGSGDVSRTNNFDDVKREAESYLQAMLDRMKYIELLEYAGTKDAIHQLSRHLYRVILRASVMQSLATEIRIREEKGVVAMAWQNFVAWSSQSSRLFPSLLLLALLFPLIMMLLWHGLSKTPSMDRYLSRQPLPMTKPSLTDVDPPRDEGSTIHIQSDASSDDMEHQMNQDPLLDIVHSPSILGSGDGSSLMNVDEHDLKRNGVLKKVKDQMNRHLYRANAHAKLEAFPRTDVIQPKETCNEFPVLVRFTAAAVPMPHTGTDVVVVLDIRSSLPGERLEVIKEATITVARMLSPDDRLSIISFGTDVQRLLELTYMSDHGLDIAWNEVQKLEAKGSAGPESEKPDADPLLEGALVLRGREAEGSSERVGCIMFVSAGDCREVVVVQAQARDFPVHTLGLGAHHDPKHMKHIADKASGSYYSLIDRQRQEEDMINLMAGLLLPVAARSVKITVSAHEGVAISSIESGVHGHCVRPDKLSGEINMSNIYAGEQKNFIVYLNVAEGEQGKLVTIGGWYHGCKQLPESDVVVTREESLWAAIVHHQVAAELVRLRLEKGVRAMVEENEEAARGDGLQQLWDEIKFSTEGGHIQEMALSTLEKDVAEMMKSGLPYMLSWLTCRKWHADQRTQEVIIELCQKKQLRSEKMTRLVEMPNEPKCGVVENAIRFLWSSGN